MNSFHWQREKKKIIFNYRYKEYRLEPVYRSDFQIIHFWTFTKTHKSTHLLSTLLALGYNRISFSSEWSGKTFTSKCSHIKRSKMYEANSTLLAAAIWIWNIFQMALDKIVKRWQKKKPKCSIINYNFFVYIVSDQSNSIWVQFNLVLGEWIRQIENIVSYQFFSQYLCTHKQFNQHFQLMSKILLLLSIVILLLFSCTVFAFAEEILSEFHKKRVQSLFFSVENWKKKNHCSLFHICRVFTIEHCNATPKMALWQMWKLQNRRVHIK